MPTIDVLPTADIEVRYVNPPKEGKRNGSIKDAAGQYYSVPPGLLAQFSKGMKCRVEYEPFGDNGRSVKRVIGNSVAPTVPKNNYRDRTNPSDAKQMAVLALAKECIGKLTYEQLNVDEIAGILEMCGRAYDRTLGGVQAQRRDDMDDSVEY